MSSLSLSLPSAMCSIPSPHEMIANTIENNLDRIRSDLTHRGLTYDPLMDDMLDHVCCMLEDEMEAGKDFDTSYGQVMSVIGDKSLSGIQHQTLLNLDKTYQRMKNFTYIFGLSSAILTIIGSIFKKLHWPGASILITLGMVMIILVFLPLYFITMHKEQEEKKNPVYGIVGFLTIALLLAGALFKIMHWPGAGFMIDFGLGFLVIGFIPLYVVNAFQRSGSKKITLPYVVMLLVGISIILVYSNVRMGKYLLDIYRTEALTNADQTTLTRERTAYFLRELPDSLPAATTQKILQIHEKAVDIQASIGLMQEALLDAIQQPGVDLKDARGIDNKHAGRVAILDSGRGKEFADASQAYRQMLRDFIEDPVTWAQIEDHLEYTSEYYPHEFGPDHVAEQPFIKNYYKLSDASKGIALAEYVAIASLMHP